MSIRGVLTDRHSRSVEERGASLIMALVFITSLSFMSLATLDVGDSAAREDRAIQAVHVEVYGGSAAMDVYVAAMRSTLTWGREGVGCADLTYTLSDARSAIVSCEPVHGSGVLIQNGAGAYTDRIVDLIATIDGSVAATGQVEFIDGGGATPGAVVRVRHWDTAR